MSADLVADDLAFDQWMAAVSWPSLEPGPALGFEVSETPVKSMPAGMLVEAVRAHGRMIAHHEAMAAEAMAELATRQEYRRCSNPDTSEKHDPARSAGTEVSLAMTWTPSHADAQVRLSVELVNQLPSTWEALLVGRIDAYKARIIAEATAALADDPELRGKAEAAALGVAGSKTGPALRAFVNRQVMRLAPDKAEKERTEATKSRRVSKPFGQADGMACMELYGPIADLAALHTAADAAARARRDAAAKATKNGRDHPDAGLTLDELRFDTLTDTGWTALNLGHLGCCNPDHDTAASANDAATADQSTSADDPATATTSGSAGTGSPAAAAQRLGGRHGRPATVNVTVPFTTLLGIDDDPGMLHGYGIIHPDVARRIAAEATWRRVLTDPATGALLDYGTTRYAPPQHLADHIIARDQTCRFPTCSWTAEACDLDHTVPYKPDRTGGPTAPGNLGAFHDRHHLDKTHHGYTVSQPEPGTFTITTPAGHAYTVDPEAIGPITESPPPEPTESRRSPQPADSDPPPF